MSIVSADVDHLVKSVEADIIAWRRYLHQHPRLSHQEEPTIDYIESTLEKISLHTNTNGIKLHLWRPTPNSLAADLHGSAGKGRIIALRADIDALPLQEDTGLAFASTTPGVMHGSGHDAHAAMLLGACKVLCELHHRIKGTVRFLFQPAEETSPSGAKQMVDAGVMKGVAMVFGFNTDPMAAVGTVASRWGVAYATVHDFDITLTGRGGHASMPHVCRDPILAGATLVDAIQSMVARRFAAATAPVISVTSVMAGTGSFNVIPDSLNLKGTMRTVDKVVEASAMQWLKDTIASVAASFEMTSQVSWPEAVYSVDNDEKCFQLFKKVCEERLPLRAEGFSVATAPSMLVEDFSEFQLEAPGCFGRLGVAHADPAMNFCENSAKYNPNEEGFTTGTRLHVALIEELLIHD